MYDPFMGQEPRDALHTLYDQINAGPRNPYNPVRIQRGSRRPPPNPTSPFNEQEYSDYLKAEEQKAPWYVSWIKTLGDNLDKFGRPVRAALGGLGNLFGADNKFDAKELLAWVPFSDSMGLTDHKNQTTSRDLLGYGEDEDLKWWQHGLTLGTDILTNPLTFYTPGLGGAVKTGGTVLKRAGAAAKSANPFKSTMALGTATNSNNALTGAGKIISQLDLLPQMHADRLAGLTKGSELATHLNQVLPTLAPEVAAKLKPLLDAANAGQRVGLQAAGRFSLPFTGGKVGFNIGGGGKVSQLLSEAMTFPFGSGGRISDWWRTSGRFLPGIDPINRAFSGSRGGMGSKEGTWFMENLHRPLTEKTTQRARDLVETTKQRLAKSLDEKYLDEGVDTVISRLGQDLPMDAATQRVFNTLSPAQQQLIQSEVSGLKGLSKQNFDTLINQGTNVAPELTGIGHWHRQMTGPKASPGTSEVLHKTFGGVAPGTLERGFPNISKETLNQLATDQTIKQLASQGREADAIAHIIARYGGPGGVPGNEASAVFKFFRALPNEYAERGLKLYGNPALADQTQHIVKMAREVGANEAKHKAMSLLARPMREAAELGNQRSWWQRLTGQKAPDYTDLDSVLPSVDLGTDAGQHYLTNMLSAAKGKPTAPGSMGVTKNMADALAHAQGVSVAPESKGQLLRGWDALSNMFKTWVTTPFPQYHVTNKVGGVFQNLLSGVLGGGGVARTLIKGGTVKGLAKKLPQLGVKTDQEASDLLRRMLQSHGIVDSKAGLFGDMVTHAGNAASKDPLLTLGMKGFFEGTDPKTWNPLHTRGAFGKDHIMGAAPSTGFKPLSWLEGKAAKADAVNRTAHFYTKLKQGLTPEGAKASTFGTHYDTRLLAPFERSVLQRLFPFYGWSKMNAEAFAKKIFNEPGKMNALAQGYERLDDGKYKPEHLRGNLNIARGDAEEWQHPVSGRKELRQKFLQLLPMLPHEEALRWLDQSRGGENYLEKIVKQSNPIIRNLWNLIAEDKYKVGGPSHRENRLLPEASDLPGAQNSLLQTLLDKPEARSLWELSPFSRFYSTAQRLRKGVKDEMDPLMLLLGELGGPRLRQVDLLGAKERDERKVIENELEASGIFRKRGGQFYLPQEMLARATPQDMMRYRAYQTMLGLAQEHSLQRKVETASKIDPILQQLMGVANPSPMQQQRIRELDWLRLLAPRWQDDLRKAQRQRGTRPSAMEQAARRGIENRIRIGMRSLA